MVEISQLTTIFPCTGNNLLCEDEVTF